MKDQIQNFDEFITWLKIDGLKPKKSERLWRKKIFSNLMNQEVKTLENYQDFIIEKKIKKLVGKTVRYKNINETICDYKIITNYYIFITCISKSIINVEHDMLDVFIKECIEKVSESK